MPFVDAGHSVSGWISSLRGGDFDSAQRLWDRYRAKLMQVARRKLPKSNRLIADEEDVAQSVLIAIWKGYSAGKFDDIKNRDDIWWLLVTIARRKITSSTRKESALKRGGHFGDRKRVKSTDSSGGELFIQGIVDRQPTPEFVSALVDEEAMLMSRLRDDQLKSIARLRITGYSVPEIAEKLTIAQRSVERKLRLVRREWSEVLIRAS
jgi:DNA-directed RNA polymerase specialized sigma24 family protein